MLILLEYDEYSDTTLGVGRTPQDDGYYALWASVLLRAIADMDIATTAKSAKNYIFDDPSTGAGSLEWCCYVLGLDAYKLRIMCSTREGRRNILNKLSWLEVNDKKDKLNECT